MMTANDTRRFDPQGGFAKSELDDESHAFLDALDGSLTVQTERLVKVIDHRFRVHARRFTKLDRELRGYRGLLAEIRALRRAVIMIPAAASILLAGARIVGLI